jgi:UDP-N-acetyl-D-mannosaminuronate dehydrogenase
MASASIISQTAAPTSGAHTTMNLSDVKLSIIGLGYVGLPLAVEFGKKRSVMGFDINAKAHRRAASRARLHAGDRA